MIHIGESSSRDSPSSSSRFVRYPLVMLFGAFCVVVALCFVGFSGSKSTAHGLQVQTATNTMAGRSPPHTVFDDIIAGKEPATVLYEDDQCIAIKSNHPLAPVHFLVLPKKHIQTLSYVVGGDQMLLGKMMLVASKVAKEQKVDGAYRVVINNDNTTIQYLHIHVLGGRAFDWPPG